MVKKNMIKLEPILEKERLGLCRNIKRIVTYDISNIFSSLSIEAFPYNDFSDRPSVDNFSFNGVDICVDSTYDGYYGRNMGKARIDIKFTDSNWKTFRRSIRIKDHSIDGNKFLSKLNEVIEAKKKSDEASKNRKIMEGIDMTNTIVLRNAARNKIGISVLSGSVIKISGSVEDLLDIIKSVKEG